MRFYFYLFYKKIEHFSIFFFFSSRRRHTRLQGDWSSDVCSSDLDLAVSTFGRIDVLFNLAGRSHFGWIESVTDEEWDAARRDEVDVIFRPTRAAWPHLVASSGVVVNMA